MAITIENLKELVKKEGLRFLLDPERPALHLGMGGMSGRFDMVVTLQDEGRFLQLRTVTWLSCPSDHPHCALLLRILGELNYQRRLVKFGWDSSDGEIVAYADLWIMDGTVTQAQFNRMMSNYVPTVDQANARIKAALETGKDPGEEATLKVLASGAPGAPSGPPPPELKELLERLAERMKTPAAKKPEGDTISEL
jgi:hypothetical protein